MRLYLSGSITAKGVNDARAMFLEERKRLRSVGFEVIDPTEFPPASEIGWIACMQRDIGLVAESDGIALIDTSPMTDVSHGVKIEQEVARYIGLPIMSVNSWVAVSDRSSKDVIEDWRDREFRSAMKPRLQS